MLILLPPSQAKRDGGVDGVALDLGELGWPSLTPPREAVLSRLRRLARNASAMAAALRLGPTQQAELTRNRTLTLSAVMPAMARYTGVLYDALAIETLSDAARAFAVDHLVIHSALFGLLRAADPIPAYRLSHDSRLPGLPLRKVWSLPISAVLADYPGLILDARSEAYVALGPAPTGSISLRLMAEGPDGRTRALNHFNKKGKGEFVRALLESAIDQEDVAGLLSWADGAGFRLAPGVPGELELSVGMVG